ncbi:MAG: hypothetical protein BWZ10_00753 [candidate division BRC1 bacterium ADurb.BinA364]|nr:MAG: hypothetical protein BWZ10_00753 [candidate division BRC1 bacterium ADurb.BinA364]
MPITKSASTLVPKDGVSSICSSSMSSTSDTSSTMIPMVTLAPPRITWTTMMQVLSVSSWESMPNFKRRSTTGMTLPRRLITPRMKAGVRGTRVTFIMPMISWTLRISSPYSSSASLKVKCLPGRAIVRAVDSDIFDRLPRQTVLALQGYWGGLAEAAARRRAAPGAILCEPGSPSR